ncbi:MAG: sugar kinase [Brevibacillus sp.]|nr:sugar kinase [Brevibacillus sp.]
MAEIITIGEILVEVMAKNNDQKFEETGEYVGPFPSGAPAIFIDQAARCGSRSLIISAIGSDGFGRMNLHRLQRDGVDVSRIKVLEGQTTGVAFVTYQKDGERDFIYHISNAACGYIDEKDVCEEDFRDCHFFHVMGSSIYNRNTYLAITKGIELCLKQGGKISFDPNVRKEIITDNEKRNLLIEILYQSHIILLGEKELSYLMGEEQERKNVETLLGRGAEMIIVKRGKRGATLYTPNNTVHVGAYPVEEVDSTGAGDCFGGTFVSCINQGLRPEVAVRLASLAGAKAVTKKGPMEGNTTLEELKRMYEEHYNQKPV